MFDLIVDDRTIAERRGQMEAWCFFLLLNNKTYIVQNNVCLVTGRISKPHFYNQQSS